MDLVKLAEKIQGGDQFNIGAAASKLILIAAQVKFLQDQALKILADARLDNLLNQTTCIFKKIPGRTYYVYKQRRFPEREIISMISPEEWGDDCPVFVGSYRLEEDLSWTRTEDIAKKDEELKLINKMLEHSSKSAVEFLLYKEKDKKNNEETENMKNEDERKMLEELKMHED
ncbi:uncharacterized protein C1orf50 homolog isoform X2 [Eurytemora carolleeae]|nr:uncharacterized protein C1orf50 homolog isoform X2 [Eurytemora carolleeae]|eukprot:XP_023339996.1 uncharacterized protein C1orf50 homolog isoform X2 [Eurytemora affinis]